MRKVVGFLFLILTFLSALDMKNMSLVDLYKNHYYTYICMNRWKFINKYSKINEDYLSLVAYSCIKKNFLTPALDLAKVMRRTKTGRNNSLYITELFMMKLLIERYIKDNYDISLIKFPEISDNLLATIFNLIKSQKPIVKNNSFEVIENNNKKYIVKFYEDINNLVILIYQNNILIKKVKIW